MMSQKLDKRFTFRLTQSENAELDRTAKLLGCSPSDAVRMGLTSLNLAAKELSAAK